MAALFRLRRFEPLWIGFPAFRSNVYSSWSLPGKGCDLGLASGMACISSRGLR